MVDGSLKLGYCILRSRRPQVSPCQSNSGNRLVQQQLALFKVGDGLTIIGLDKIYLTSQAPGHGAAVVGLKAPVCQVQCLVQSPLPHRQPRIKQRCSGVIRIPFPDALQSLFGLFDQTDLKEGLDLKKMIFQVVLKN